jgi:hypothetical protein
MNQILDYLSALRHKLASKECHDYHSYLGGISAGAADRRRPVLRVYADHLSRGERMFLREMRQHFAPYYGLSKSGGPAYCVWQNNQTMRRLEEQGLVKTETGRHGTQDVRFTDLGFQVSQFV